MKKAFTLIMIHFIFVLFVFLPNGNANNIFPFETIRDTNFVMAGTGGMRGVGTGSFSVTGISGVITKAYLYWHGPTNSSNPNANRTVTLNGEIVQGENIGLSHDNCWGFQNSQAYRADVTALVEAKGNGTYTLSNFIKPGGIDINGAALLVFFYDEDFTNDRDVVIFNGNDSNIANSYDELGWNVTLTRIEYVSGAAKMHLIVGDGQDWLDDAIKINGLVAIPSGQIFRGDLGPRTRMGSLWDIKTIDVTQYLNPGLNTLSLTTGTYSDCLSLVVAVIDLPAGAAPCNVGETLTTSGIYWTQSCATSDRTKIPITAAGFDSNDGVLESDIGEKLELQCYGSYELFYTSPTGQKNRVGKCPFYGGCNSAYFTHSGDANRNRKPDCFGRIFWQSRDYYSNDIPNPWTGEESENPPRFDIATTIFDAGTGHLTKKSFKHEYGWGETFWPLWPHDCGSYQPHALVDVLEVDPRVGPETEAFFDDVDRVFRSVVNPDPFPMTRSQFSPADLNRDGVTDSLDSQIFQQAFGKCRGQEGFNPEADLNLDGCVTSADSKMFKDLYNKPPIAEAGADQVIQAGGNCLGTVTLDGSGSSDPNGDTLTYTWTGSFGVANGSTPVVTLGLGIHSVSLTVNDGKGGMASDTVKVTVEDKIPPRITNLTASPSVLWPPNHKMVPVMLAVSTSDNCDVKPVCKITSVKSDEPEDGLGDGDTGPDWQISGDLTVNLRSERSGVGSGRVYTIAVMCTDASGNSSTRTVDVPVPHDQGK